MARDVKREPTARRRYRSPRREDQARQTRRAIRDAAASLFVARGYAATSVAAVAEAAGVAPETVYAQFKSKRALLKEVIDVAIAGDDEPIAVRDRPWMDAVRAEQDPRVRLRMLARVSFERVARVGPVLEVLRSAAATDPSLAALWDEMQRQRMEDARSFVTLVAELSPTRLDEETAAALSWALAGPEMHRALVTELGWPTERYVALMEDVLTRVAFDDDVTRS